MSTREDTAPSQPVATRDELVAWIAAGAKPPERWCIGTEHEKFLFHTSTLKPVPYEGDRGVRALMQALIDRYGWQPIAEGGTVIIKPSVKAAAKARKVRLAQAKARG